MKKARKDQRLEIRLTATEKEILKLTADLHGLNVAEYARMAFIHSITSDFKNIPFLWFDVRREDYTEEYVNTLKTAINIIENDKEGHFKQANLEYLKECLEEAEEALSDPILHAIHLERERLLEEDMTTPEEFEEALATYHKRLDQRRKELESEANDKIKD